MKTLMLQTERILMILFLHLLHLMSQRSWDTDQKTVISMIEWKKSSKLINKKSKKDSWSLLWSLSSSPKFKHKQILFSSKLMIRWQMNSNMWWQEESMSLFNLYNRNYRKVENKLISRLRSKETSRIRRT